MAGQNRKAADAPKPAQAPRDVRGPKAAGPTSVAARSPALELQSRLSANIETNQRWAPGATVAFVVASCGGFWAAVAWGVSRLIH